MKLIHLSDIQLDRSFVAAALPPEFCNACREDLQSTLNEAFKYATEQQADAVLIAGNLLDSARYMPGTLRWFKERLEALGDMPVLVAGGATDPYNGDSPYSRGVWPENLHFFGDTWSCVELPHAPLSIAGCSKTGVESTLPPFPEHFWTNQDRCKIVLAHATPLPEAHYKLRPPLLPATEQAHYLALGGTNPDSYVMQEAPALIAYPGMQQAGLFEDIKPKSFLEVSIENTGSENFQVSAAPIPLNNLMLLTEHFECDESLSAKALLNALEEHLRNASFPPERSIVRLTLSGVLPLKVRGMLPDIQDTLRETFFYLELLDETLPQSFYEAYGHNNTTLGNYLRRISHEIKDAPDHRRWRVLCRAREAGWVAFHPEIPFPAHGVEEDIL